MAAFCVSRFPLKRSVRSFLSCVGAALFLTISAPGVLAQFVAGAGTDTPLFFTRQYTWTWPAAGNDVPLSHGNTNWERLLEGTPGAAAGSRDLVVRVRHKTAPHDGEDAPNYFMTLSRKGLVRPAGMGKITVSDVAQAAHNDHWDACGMIVDVNGVAAAGPTADISTLGTHTETKLGTGEFVQYTTTDETLTVTLQPQFRDEYGNIVPGEPHGPFAIAPGVPMSEPLPIDLIGMALTGFTLEAQGSGLSNTTLGFTGGVNENVSQLNLGIGIQLFGQLADTPVPFFYQPGDVVFVAVNLTKYLAASPHVEPGQLYFFEHGVCPELPGVLASAYPVQFVPGSGYETFTPFTGVLVVQGLMRPSLTHSVRVQLRVYDYPPAAPVPVTIQMRPTEGGEAIEETVMAEANGTFELRGYPAGSYSLRVKGEKWLADSVPVDVTLDTVPEVSLELLGGDTNNDNSVDVLDLDALIQAFDSTEEDSHWNENTDFNGDGATDVLDLDILIQNFDKTGDS